MDRHRGVPSMVPACHAQSLPPVPWACPGSPDTFLALLYNFQLNPLTEHLESRAARRRSGHGQSDGGQARAGVAASGTAPTHADLLQPNICCTVSR